jgi:hypothetical protein
MFVKSLVKAIFVLRQVTRENFKYPSTRDSATNCIQDFSYRIILNDRRL